MMPKEADTITDLLELQIKGDYWDFKRDPHQNNADLVHDILCTANCLHEGPRYLIIGVSDPKDGCEIVGLTPDQSGRKTQADVINFLSRIDFAGNYRPEVLLRTIIHDTKELDVIEIADGPYKPYYLTRQYSQNGKTVRPFHVYTRKMGDGPWMFECLKPARHKGFRELSMTP